MSGNITALIAEDDAISRLALSKNLENAGFSVITAVNGRHALEQLEDHPKIQVVITDMMMPEMSGRELIEALRAAPRWRDLPVIMISAVITSKEITSLLEPGKTWFFQKPVNIDALLERLEEAAAPDSPA